MDDMRGIPMVNEKSSEMRPRVVVYALSTCSHCKDVKRLLDSRGVEYRSIEVDLLEGEDRKKAIEEVKQYNSRATFPTTLIGDKVIVGSKKDQIKDALAQVE
jgi:glutaredoxin